MSYAMDDHRRWLSQKTTLELVNILRAKLMMAKSDGTIRCVIRVCLSDEWALRQPYFIAHEW